jgi:hypothetical protein
MSQFIFVFVVVGAWVRREHFGSFAHQQAALCGALFDRQAERIWRRMAHCLVTDPVSEAVDRFDWSCRGGNVVRHLRHEERRLVRAAQHTRHCLQRVAHASQRIVRVAHQSQQLWCALRQRLLAHRLDGGASNISLLLRIALGAARHKRLEQALWRQRGVDRVFGVHNRVDRGAPRRLERLTNRRRRRRHTRRVVAVVGSARFGSAKQVARAADKHGAQKNRPSSA